MIDDEEPTTTTTTSTTSTTTNDDDEIKAIVAESVGVALFAVADHGDETWRAMMRHMIRRTIHLPKPPPVVGKNKETETNKAKQTQQHDVVVEPQQQQQAPLLFFDIEVRTAPALFRRFARQQRAKQQQQQQHDDGVDVDDDNNEPGREKDLSTSSSCSCSCWTIRSPYGVERDVTSSAQLAELLLPELERQVQARHLARHVRIAPRSNFICITTYEYEKSLLLSWSSSSSSLPCPYCPIWCRSYQSLWWHLQRQHNTVHHAAVEMAAYHETRYTTALVVYVGNNNGASGGNCGNSAGNSRSSTDDDDNNTTRRSPLPLQQRRQLSNAVVVPDIIVAAAAETPWDAVKRGVSVAELQRLLPSLPSSSTSSTASSSLDPPTPPPQEHPQQHGRGCCFDPQRDRDHHGSLLLHWAAGGGHLDLVRYLVEERGCDVNAVQVGHRSFAGRTPLHWAARHGHVAVVDYLLTSFSLSSSSTDDEDNNNNHNNNTNMVVDAVTADGTTAFCWAAWQGHVPILERLYTAGCDVQSCNRFGCNAALWAAQTTTTTTGGGGGGGGNSLSSSSSSSRPVTTLQWLLDHGCPIFVTNVAQHGVLHKAAQRGHDAICHWFVDRLRQQLDIVTNVNVDNDDDSGSSSDSVSNNNSMVVSRRNVWDLIGPDLDQCCPSDLAGMEGHVALAHWLATTEMSLVVQLQQQGRIPLSTSTTTTTSSSTSMTTTTTTSDIPNWLTPYSVPVHCFEWVSGGGVLRMRSVFSVPPASPPSMVVVAAARQDTVDC